MVNPIAGITGCRGCVATGLCCFTPWNQMVKQT